MPQGERHRRRRAPAGVPDDGVADREAEHGEQSATTNAASRNELRLFAEIWP